MDYREMFRVPIGSKVELRKIDPDFTAKHKNKNSAKKKLVQYTQEVRRLQYQLYAEGERSLLICLQGLDAAGKDGTINHVLGAMNPQGVRVHSFKIPTLEEAGHDFLWRIEKQVPSIGEVVIFNRSHYEDVLAARVHKIVSKETWLKRYEFINEFEKRLVSNGTHILKFFLHISPEEQLERFKQRLDDPACLWKISESDYTERELWPAYMRAYEDALTMTSTKYAPWYVIPSNHKWFRNLCVAKIIIETFESLKMKLPAPKVDIDQIRRKYHKALNA